MAVDPERIEQFRKMAEADPENELGHFSLGRAYYDAGMYEPAVGAFLRTLELNPNLSRAYQLMGMAQLKLEQKEKALQTLTEGVKVADARGDLMPRNEMMRTLKDLGAPVPDLATKQQREVGQGEVQCHRCNQIKPRLPGPPFRNQQGQEIYDKICADCWREWIGMGTKVINELRLPLADPQAQRIYDQHMLEFLNLR